MVLVPLGISMNSWTKSIDPKAKSGNQNNSFSDNTGDHLFQRVSHSSSKEKKSSTKKNSLGKLIPTKIISPVQQVLEQTKEKEKRSDGPDTVDVSFNMASTSSGIGNKLKKKKPTKKRDTTSTKTSKKKSVKKSVGSTIKRLQRKRNSQSKKKLGTGKKSSSIKKS